MKHFSSCKRHAFFFSFLGNGFSFQMEKKKGCEHLGCKNTSKYGSDLAIHSKQTISQQEGRKEGRKDQESSKQKRNNIQTGN